MRKPKLSRELLTLAILTAMTVFTWIGLELQRTLTKKEFPQITQEQLTPLNPEIDNKALEKLGEKREFGLEELIIPQVSEATQTGQQR